MGIKISRIGGRHGFGALERHLDAVADKHGFEPERSPFMPVPRFPFDPLLDPSLLDGDDEDDF